MGWFNGFLSVATAAAACVLVQAGPVGAQSIQTEAQRVRATAVAHEVRRAVEHQAALGREALESGPEGRAVHGVEHHVEAGRARWASAASRFAA